MLAAGRGLAWAGRGAAAGRVGTGLGATAGVGSAAGAHKLPRGACRPISSRPADELLRPDRAGRPSGPGPPSRQLARRFRRGAPAACARSFWSSARRCLGSFSRARFRGLPDGFSKPLDIDLGEHLGPNGTPHRARESRRCRRSPAFGPSPRWKMPPFGQPGDHTHAVPMGRSGSSSIMRFAWARSPCTSTQSLMAAISRWWTMRSAVRTSHWVRTSFESTADVA